MALLSKTLYNKDVKGAIREWTIAALPYGFVISYGQVGGAMISREEHVPYGKSNRTLEEQIELQMNHRISLQKDKGYVESYEEALANRSTNALNLLKPMLAQTISMNKIDLETAYVQRKYDGNRCIITCTDNFELVAYSRNGKPITTINHILNDLKLLPGESIDGELYIYGKSLQEIVSFVKKKQKESKNLCFHAYDFISNEPFQQRFRHLSTLIPFDNPHIQLVPTQKVNRIEAIYDHFRQFREEGYEGAIIRHTNLGYEDGKRSNSLVKLKEWFDDEFFVIDITETKDGWARLVCRTEDGNVFSVTCHGTHEYKKKVYQDRLKYIGKVVTVEYAYLTADKIPFHPVAKCWRYEEI